MISLQGCQHTASGPTVQSRTAHAASSPNASEAGLGSSVNSTGVSEAGESRELNFDEVLATAMNPTVPSRLPNQPSDVPNSLSAEEADLKPSSSPEMTPESKGTTLSSLTGDEGNRTLAGSSLRLALLPSTLSSSRIVPTLLAAVSASSPRMAASELLGKEATAKPRKSSSEDDNSSGSQTAPVSSPSGLAGIPVWLPIQDPQNTPQPELRAEPAVPSTAESPLAAIGVSSSPLLAQSGAISLSGLTASTVPSTLPIRSVAGEHFSFGLQLQAKAPSSSENSSTEQAGAASTVVRNVLQSVALALQPSTSAGNATNAALPKNSTFASTTFSPRSEAPENSTPVGSQIVPVSAVHGTAGLTTSSGNTSEDAMESSSLRVKSTTSSGTDNQATLWQAAVISPPPPVKGHTGTPVTGTQSAPLPQEPSTLSTGGAAKELVVRLQSQTGETISVRFTDQGGQVQVAVRSSDPSTATALRQDLSSLTSNLERAGWKAETVFSPDSLAPAPLHLATSSGSSDSQESSSSRGSFDWSMDDQTKKRYTIQELWDEILSRQTT